MTTNLSFYLIHLKISSGFDHSKHSITDNLIETCDITVDGYTYAVNTWGNSFYKTYEKMDYLDAKTQCESDGAYLAIPRSAAENAFIAGLIPNENIWIGVNDIDEEGTFVAVDGQEVSYTKWKSYQPDNYLNEDGVHILGDPNAANGFWNDQEITVKYQFVCMFNVKFDYSGKF